MGKIRLLFRLLGIVFIVLWGCVQAALFFRREGRKGRQKRVRDWSRQCMLIFGLRLTVHGADRFFAQGGQFIVSNHISWLDIFVVNAVHAVRFVAKEEVRKWPVMGWLSARAETVFIKRTQLRSSQQVTDVLVKILEEDDYAVVFPEGTSTDGTEIKPFKSSLFDAAVRSGKDVWPLLIYYPKADGSANTDLAYYGDLSMWQSFCKILPQKHAEAVLYFLDPIRVEGKDRQQLCNEAQQRIAEKLAELQGVTVDAVIAKRGAAFGVQNAQAERVEDSDG